MKLSTYTKRTIIGGVLSLLVIISGFLILGSLSGYEAKVLIKNSITDLNTLCNTIALASATILALLLTLLSLSSGTNSKLKKDHYQHVRIIEKVGTAVFICAVIGFLLFNLPITESDMVPNNWYSVIYFLSLGFSSILSASLIIVVLMLYNTVVNIIKIVELGQKNHPLTVGKE